MGPIYAVSIRAIRFVIRSITIARRTALPILFHTGTTFNHNAPLNFGRPWLFDDVAIKYPDLHMILAHVGHPFF